MKQNKKIKSKKQLIKVMGLPKGVCGAYYNGTEEGMYLTCGANMAFMSSPSDGRTQCTRFVQCRNYLQEMVRVRVFEEGGHGYISSHYVHGENPPIDMKKFRLLVAVNLDKCYGCATESNFKEMLFSAKRVLNFYEEVAGFDKTKITTVNHEVVKHAWLFTGPKEWMAYPSLLSMATFIIKFSTLTDPIEFSDKESIERELMNANVRYRSGYNGNTYKEYMNQHCKKLYIVAKRHRDIFKRTTREAYGITDLYDGSFHGGIGFVMLCTYQHLDKELCERMKKVVAEEGGK